MTAVADELSNEEEKVVLDRIRPSPAPGALGVSLCNGNDMLASTGKGESTLPL